MDQPHNQEEYYRTILDGIRDPLLVMDRELTCHFVNRAAHDILDIDPSGPQGRSCHELVHGLDLSCQERGEVCPVLEAMESGDMVRTIKEFTVAAGLVRSFEISAVPLKNEAGEVTEVVEVLRDITASLDHMKLQELTGKIEMAKREWEATMDCVQDFIILVDDKERIKRFNRPLADFSSLPFDEILEQELSAFMAAQGLEVELCLLDSKECECRHRASGRSFTMHSYPLATESGLMRVVTFHDISQRQEASQALEEKNQELAQAFSELKAAQAQLLQQEKMASVGQLAAGVAHEINNPIGFVTSNINSLVKYQRMISDFIEFQEKFIKALCPSTDILKTLAKQRRKMKIDFILGDISDLINESLDGVERVKKIVMNLKNFSRVDQAQQSLAHINDCLDDTITIAWNELKYKCTIAKEYGELPPITCYPQQLNQVFMNLLVNGAQAMAEPGTITIKTWFAEDSIFITISDTGCGIAPDHLSHVFEPFFTTKDVGQGTGLGLSISYDIIVKQHNGGISIQSKEGEGTTFTICLPLPDQEETP